jgi:hypothetical protein
MNLRRTLFCLMLSVIGSGLARAHDGYHDWVNRAGLGCCNNRDCAPIDPSEVRSIGGKLHVYVRGVGVARGEHAWCPVLSHHYLRSGNAPDPSTPHACISGHYGATTPCEQFICFQPQAQF